MKVKLNILASDILAKFYWSSDCPITRALRRAGINGSDNGTNIILDGKEITSLDKKDYEDLVVKLLGMYSTKDKELYTVLDKEINFLPIEDFEAELELNISEDQIIK